MEKDCSFVFIVFIQRILKMIEDMYYVPNALTSQRSESAAVERVLMPVLLFTEDSRH